MQHPIRSLARALAAVLVTALAAQALPAASLRVVCTIPDLADVVGEIGGERVDITTIARGKENLHFVTPRPSHLIAMNRADLYVQIGLSLESGFAPGLLEGSRNPRIQPGQPGFCSTSEGWSAIDVPVSVSRQAGDVHPHGNPHMNLDPRAGRHVAGRVLAGLVAVDPRGREEYERRHARYLERLAQAEERWAEAGRAWKGRRVVLYHQEYNYLAARYGLEIVGSIEARPGIPPTPNHVAALVEVIRARGADAILTAVWSNDANTARVAEATGVSVVELPNQCGALPGTQTWIGMMDVVHARLGRVLGAQERDR